MTNKDWDLYGDGVRLLNSDGYGLLDVHRVRPVNGHFDGYWHWLLNRVRHVFVDRVRFWDWHLHGHWVGLVDWDRVGPVDWNVHGHWHGLFNWNSVRHGLLDGVRGRYMYGVRPVNRDLDWDTNVFYNGVGLRYGYLNFDGVWHVFLHGVGLRNWHLYGVRDVLLNGVRLGNQNLDGVGPVDGNVNGVRNLLLYGVGSGHMDWDFNVFFHVNRHVFDDLVGLGYGHLHGVRYGLFYGVWDWLLDGVGDWNTLNYGDGLGDVMMFSQVDSIAAIP